jgi:hypothetical protein
VCIGDAGDAQDDQDDQRWDEQEQKLGLLHQHVATLTTGQRSAQLNPSPKSRPKNMAEKDGEHRSDDDNDHPQKLSVAQPS